jgi:hypothetical protein
MTSIHKNDETDLGFDLARPEAASLVESLRAFGYELPTALADLVDNSVTAKARNIWIDFYWAGSDSVLSITDDGKGMDTTTLIAAMRPGSQNPLMSRSSSDLGRFGLGLKTASFSQCRRLTVRSKTTSTEAVTRCWDLDHIADVNEWQLLRTANADAESHLQRLKRLKQGTSVTWQKMDRLVSGQVANNERQQQRFLQRAEAVRQHLSMVFHRIIGDRGAVTILVNDRPIEPWDPFLGNEPATQTLTATRLQLRDSAVEVQPYVLPHHSKMPRGAHDAAAGPRGWNAHQGFFVYRNRRLLVPGDWLGLGWAKEEHYKLARIRIDIPNSLDLDWDIDVTKSRAAPPSSFRDDLRRIGERARSEAKRVYTHRGARLVPAIDAERLLLWEPLAKHDKTFYRINRQHPLVKLSLQTSGDREALNALLRLAEETIPLPHITIANSEHPNSLPAPFEKSADGQIVEIMQQTFRSLVASGYDAKSAVTRLKTIWPFELFPALLQTLAEDHPDG